MRRRVLVLGGGCGGVAAAWALSRTPALREAIEVTVVQPGWRLGGKGATGRDPTRGHAVLEHGLHLWLGWYRGAFSMVDDLYRHWRGPTEGPQASLEAAFTPQHTVAIVGGDAAAPDIWRLRLPEVPGRPWQPEPAWIWPRLVATWVRNLRTSLIDGPDDRWTAARIRLVTELGAVIGKGLAVELARHGAAAWEEMDALDLRAWLRRHGASDAVADAPPVRGIYDLGFAYPDGVVGPDRGAAAAGTSLKVLLKMFAAYRGAPFYRMNAGMGDTVFAPAHDVLRDRGVTFRFFERLTALRTDGQRVTAVELRQQARGAERYEPLIGVGPVRAWPGAPRADQVDALAPGDLEADDGPGLGDRTLEVGRDFDDVVLAIPSTAHRRFAGDLMAANGAYRAMVEHTHAVATVAAQWWMSRTHAQLGWPGEPPVVTGLPGLFRTWADLTEVVDAEGWAERPMGLAYLCNVAPPEVQAMTDREAAGAWVASRMAAWADEAVGPVWPWARTADGRFDQGALAGPWAAQYARANVADWERYVLSLPGTTRYRLAPGGSGFENLLLAGDWTRNVVDGGSVEGAVDSGITAAAAVEGRLWGRDVG